MIEDHQVVSIWNGGLWTSSFIFYQKVNLGLDDNSSNRLSVYNGAILES